MISVIIPVYNIEPYIEDCIRSVAAQSLRDLQIIAVDDGSSDGSGTICDRLAREDSRIRVVHQANGGLSVARNTGLDAAEGEYIAFVDGDDRIHPDMLRQLAACMKQTDCDIAQCEYLAFADAIPQTAAEEGFDVYGRESAMRELIRNHRFQQVVWNKLYKRSLIGNLRFPQGKFHEDEFFTWQAFLHAEKIAALHFVGYYYRSRQGSIMDAEFSKKRLDALDAMAQRTAFLREKMPCLYADSAAAFAENLLYQYQRFLLLPASRERDACMMRIGQYLQTLDRSAVIRAVGEKQKMWFRLFFAAPEKTAALRNRLKIGF